jgi:hypothetical protein
MRLRVIPLLVLLLALTAPPHAHAQGVDYRVYAELLRDHVKNGVVDYAGLKKREKDLDSFLAVIGRVNPDTLPLDEQKAYYINAYNAWTIKLILDNHPVKSIRDIGSVFSNPWKIEFVRIAGRPSTLDHIEHGILRPRFKDPRIHAAINCASKGCPPLRPEPYEAKWIEIQLDEAARGFINDTALNRLEGNVLMASSIFDWFGEDFGGKPGIVAFFRRHADERLRQGLDQAGGGLVLRFLKYDWSLNGN